MAADAVDFALGDRAQERPSVTETIALVGAEDIALLRAGRGRYAQRYGWDEDRITHLLERYGAQIGRSWRLLMLIRILANLLNMHRSSYAPMSCSLFATKAPLHLEDVLVRRVRLDLEQRDRGLAAAPKSLRLCDPSSLG